MLYDDLDRFFGGAEPVMIHAGMTRGRWLGHIFQPAYFETWCTLYARVVNASIRLTKLHTDRWAAKTQTRGPNCPSCHNSDEFDVRPIASLPTALAEYTCRRCGTTTTRDPDRTGRHN